tara:strand:+ start:85 stop:513 length:429 start_codon:yes stop_codon:yes gene_type:complete
MSTSTCSDESNSVVSHLDQCAQSIRLDQEALNNLKTFHTTLIGCPDTFSEDELAAVTAKISVLDNNIQKQMEALQEKVSLYENQVLKVGKVVEKRLEVLSEADADTVFKQNSELKELFVNKQMNLMQQIERAKSAVYKKNED